MEVGWDPVLVTVTFLDQWRSVGSVFHGGFKVVSWFLVGFNSFSIEVGWVPVLVT